MAGRPRKGSPEHVNIAMRRGDAMRMRRDGYSYPEIALALGYRTYRAAMQDVSRGMVEYVGEPANEVRVLELARLDEMWQAAIGVMRRPHVTVSDGRVVKVADALGVETPLLDDEPILKAIDKLLKIQDRRSRLLGLDAPTRVEVISDAAIDDEIRRLSEELDGRAEAAEASGTAGFEAAQG